MPRIEHMKTVDLAQFVSISLDEGVEAKEGFIAKADQVIKNLSKMIITKLIRLQNKIVDGQWIKSEDVYKKLTNDITNLTSWVKGSSKIEDKDNLIIYIIEMKAICELLEKNKAFKSNKEVKGRAVELTENLTELEREIITKENAYQVQKANREKTTSRLQHPSEKLEKSVELPELKRKEQEKIIHKKKAKEEGDQPGALSEEISVIKPKKKEHKTLSSNHEAERTVEEEAQVDASHSHHSNDTITKKQPEAEETAADTHVTGTESILQAKEGAKTVVTSVQVQREPVLELVDELKGLIDEAYKTKTFKESIGEWLGSFSKENRILNNFKEKEFHQSAIEDIKSNIQQVVKILEKGFNLPKTHKDMRFKIKQFQEKFARLDR